MPLSKTLKLIKEERTMNVDITVFIDIGGGG